MALITLDFNSLVTKQAQAIQGKAQQLIDFSIGSVLRAIVESNSSIALWIQGLILYLLATTRAATSSGTDLDSWGADFNFTRLAAQAASGQVTFSRFSTGISAFIAVGTKVQTSDQTAETFQVVADTTNPNYSATLGGYTLASGIVSIAVLVQALVAGTSGNVLAGQCNVLTSSIPGVDTVTNANAFTNGKDAETDSAFRTRFVAYISSLAKATKNAIAYAITSVQQGISYSLTENADYSGAAKYGYFYAVVDDGSGAPPSSFLTAVNAAIDAVRGFTITFGVFAPLTTAANVVMTITSSNHAADAALAQLAVNAYISGLGIGQSFPYTKIAQLAYEASPTITNVTGVTLNGGTADLTADNKHRIMPGTTTVN